METKKGGGGLQHSSPRISEFRELAISRFPPENVTNNDVAGGIALIVWRVNVMYSRYQMSFPTIIRGGPVVTMMFPAPRSKSFRPHARHTRWIVWKLSAMERRFPEHFPAGYLTGERVSRQLRYRYENERSALVFLSCLCPVLRVSIRVCW